MADAPPLPAGTLLSGKYRLDRLLGKGGMGAVYLAENVDIGRQVAVKVLLPEIAAEDEALARFRTEARAAAAIGHPGIAEVIDFGRTEQGAYLVMEYLEGETLGARLRRAGPMDVPTVGWVGDQLLAAIGAAHAKGVVHRDLKPDNVFLVEQPVRTVKVLDFGVSKFRQPGEVALTRTGVVMGTPAYMSPEQARGSKDVGPAADIWAVGAILYEALAGTPAFNGDSYNEIIAKVLTEPYRPLRELRLDLSGPLGAAIDRMMAKKVADRPAGAQEARALLDEAIRALPDQGPVTLRPGMTTPAPVSPGPIPLTALAPTFTPLPASTAQPPTPMPAKPPPPVGTAPSANVAAPQPASAVPVPDSRVKLARYALLAFVLFLGWRFCSWCGSCFTPSPEEPSGAAGPAAPDHAVEEPGAERDAARRSHATLDAGDVWLEYYAEPDASETAMDMAKKAPRTSALEKNRELLEEETRRRAHKRVDEESKQFEKIMGKEIKDEIRRELHKQVDQNLGKDPDQPKPKPTQ